MRIPGLTLAADLEGLPWRTTRVPGVAWIPLRVEERSAGGSSRGSATVLIRMDPGSGYEAHRHVGTEDVLVLRGGYRDALGTYEQGEHVHYPAGSVHAPVALGDAARPVGPDNPACVLFAVAPGGIELLDRAGGGPSRKRPYTSGMGTEALDRLTRELQAELAGEARGQRIAELLGGYARAQDDWRAFALFGEETYTRNLVIREERFELLVLCWGVGQESPIHNHEGQDCWMAVLDGEVEEVRYCTPAEVRPGPLAPRDAKTFRRGQVAFIRDDIALHLVRSARGDAPAISLHLYAAPYDECNCYCPETGRITRKELVNHSVRGELIEV